MVDLEKVIRGLECCRRGFCFSCPYNDGIDENVECKQKWADDALSLLKAQEPIPLENQHKPYGHIINANSPWISRCPKCSKKIEGKQTRFCKYCGQAVKWDGFGRKTLV